MKYIAKMRTQKARTARDHSAQSEFPFPQIFLGKLIIAKIRFFGEEFTKAGAFMLNAAAARIRPFAAERLVESLADCLCSRRRVSWERNAACAAMSCARERPVPSFYCRFRPAPAN